MTAVDFEDTDGFPDPNVKISKAFVLTFTISVWGCCLSTASLDLFAQSPDGTSLLNTQEQLEFIRARVANGDEPWTSGYAVIPSYLDHQPQPVQRYIDPAGHQGAPDDLMQPALRMDSEAAYGSALHWVISGDSAHARKSVEILDAWASTLESIETRQDGPLSTSYNWPRLIYAAAILRAGFDAWSLQQQQRFEEVLTTVVWNATRRAIDKDNKNNWRSLGILCRLAIAVYTQNQHHFEKSVALLQDQIGSYCYPSGQSIETARDLLHVQMGLSGMVAAAEIAWNQGLDLYGYLDNRLLQCVEWHIPHIMDLTDAQWPDSFDSPFYAPQKLLVDNPHVTIWGREVEVRAGRFDAPRAVGRVWHFYEMVYNHYHNRQGLEAPQTWRILIEPGPVIDQDDPPEREETIPVRPEGACRVGGWGTLTHVRHDLINP